MGYEDQTQEAQAVPASVAVPRTECSRNSYSRNRPLVYGRYKDRCNPFQRRAKLAKTASVALGSCPAKDVVMRVTLPRLTYDQSQTVKVSAVVQNVGRVVCTYDGTDHGDQNMGPCGTFPLSVVDSSGANIWPGPIAYSCVMISQTHLAPGKHVLVTGIWPKVVVTSSGSSSAPVGSYQLVVANTVTFMIKLQ